MAFYQIFSYKNLYNQNNKLIQLLTDRSSFIPSITEITPGDSSVSLSWSILHPESISSYKIDVYLNNVKIDTIENIQLTYHQITRLTNGNSYKFKISSILKNKKEISSSEVFSTPFKPSTVPNAPVVTAYSKNTYVSLSWIAPNDGGSPITSYKVYVNGNSTPYATTPPYGYSVYNVTGLTNGTTYGFKVSAVNKNGETSSEVVYSTPAPTVPESPNILSTTPMNTSVGLTWSPPSNNGGYPITSYKIFIRNFSGSYSRSITTPDDGTNFIVSELSNGTTYYFQVVAINQLGQSRPSTQVSGTPTVYYSGGE
jgi:hypothetical protein